MERRKFLKLLALLGIGFLPFTKLSAGRETLILNSTGYKVLKMHGMGLTPEEIARKLTQEYEVDYETAYRDVLDFLKEVKGFKL
ncbi:MAG: PqqD family protein [candidate division WOR-3 bacterium]